MKPALPARAAIPLPRPRVLAPGDGAEPAARGIELPTLALIAGCTALWAVATIWADVLTPWLAVPVVTLCLVLHSSLHHEVLHGHPTRSAALNEALVFPALGLVVPYRRFRDLHLAHHHDPMLTDPYDDPESNYLDPVVWAGLSRPLRALLTLNNTLAGRIVLGPAIGMTVFLRTEAQAILRGDRAARTGWALHALAVVPVVAWLATLGTMAAWAYALAAYLALSVLRIRTFLEHRAHEAARGRSVIIEDTGPLALLFLNNNLHAVHHGHPGVPWYRLRAFYLSRRERFLEMNDNYLYRSYADVFARHLWRTKDPVAHPLYRPEA